MTATKGISGIGMALAALALALGLAASPAGAQQTVGQGGLINVGVATGDISEVIVLQDLIDIGDVTLQDLVTLGNVTAVVQVPIGIAANVCPAVNAAVLGKAQQGGGAIECVADAMSAADSRAFSNWMQRR
jgi:hypothetical protein